jgi:hypothetical protein
MYRTSLRVYSLTKKSELSLRHTLLRHVVDLFQEQGIELIDHLFETTDYDDGSKEYGIVAIGITADEEDIDMDEPVCNRKKAVL